MTAPNLTATMKNSTSIVRFVARCDERLILHLKSTGRCSCGQRLIDLPCGAANDTLCTVVMYLNEDGQSR